MDRVLRRLAQFASKSLPGRLVRWPLALIPRGVAVPVMSGPLRGSRWFVGSHTHGCWLGIYEPSKQAAVGRFTRPGGVFYDLGANVGFYTLLAAKLGAGVVAVEPLPRKLAYLRRHLGLNHCSGVEIFECVVLDRAGYVHVVAAGPATAYVGDTGVPVCGTKPHDEVRSLGYHT